MTTSKQSRKGGAIPRKGKDRSGINVSNVAFLIAGMGLMFLITLVPRSLRSTKAPDKAERRPDISAATPAATPDGPWGHLDIIDFPLEEPDDYLPDSTKAVPKTTWYFDKLSPEQVMNLFSSVDAGPDVKQMLRTTNHWHASAEGVVVQPSLALLRELTPSARQRIYSVLADSPRNQRHDDAFRFTTRSFAECFENSGLSATKLNLIRRLTYTNASGVLCLVDIDVLQEELTADEFRKFFVSLYSEPSLLVSLRVEPQSDVYSLARYWGRGGREGEVLAILKSVARKPGGSSINAAYLLPPFARLRLYTFPDATPATPDSGQDCFWTAFNFFHDPPTPAFADANAAVAALNQDFTPTKEPPQYGDVLVFLDNLRPVHACVYIAANVVFTKNGGNYHQPWVLVRLADVTARYSSDRAMSTVVLRPNNPRHE